MDLTTRRSAVPPVASLAAAVGFVVAGASVVGHPVPDQHWGARGAVLDLAFAVGALGVAAGLPAVAGALRVGRVGRGGTRLAQAGHVALAVECVASTVHGGNTLGPVFVLGLLASLAGLAVLAVEGLRSGTARAWAPLPLVGLLVGVAAGDRGGAVVLGLVWAALGAFVVQGERAPARVPVA